MQLFTVVAYVIALSVIVVRIGLTGKRVIDVWAQQRRRSLFWPFAPLVDGLFWSRFLQMATDMTLSFLGMALTRIAIAGTASAPIGALLGLSCSAMITSGGWYFQKKTAARKAPSQS